MKVVPLAIGILAASLATISTILFITNRNEKLRTLASLAQARLDISTLEKTRDEQQSLLAKEETRLNELAAALHDDEERLTANARRISELEASLLQSKGQLTLSTENEGLLNREIAGLRKEMETLQHRLLEIEILRGQLNQREQELALFRNKLGPDGKPIQVAENADARSILAVGPENSFIIINLGAKQGALKGAQILIRRGTDFIGMALISDVLDDLSIAQIDPSTLHESLRKGDGIVLAQ